ncbi:amidohydrolase family protein [Rhodococcus sp. IEGM1428]|uniref:amidohydrolase family protein n=1 Tax=Rhodococcus sp. IEGM1428 TaxID=3392191 RepID=UPI003D0D3EFD
MATVIEERYSGPVLMDDIAAECPSLTVTVAHTSVPWVDSSISVATHEANVSIDLSGSSPKYSPPQLMCNVNSILEHEVLWGSALPTLTPDRWTKDFAEVGIQGELVPLIMRENAIHNLGLRSESA